jgi:acyl-CoA dehydrogenase-like protein
VWTTDVRRSLGAAGDARLKFCVERVSSAVQRIEQYAARAQREGSEFQQAGARGFAYAIARTEAAALLIEYATAHPEAASLASAERWCARDLTPLVEADADYRANSTALSAQRTDL